MSDSKPSGTTGTSAASQVGSRSAAAETAGRHDRHVVGPPAEHRDHPADHPAVHPAVHAADHRAAEPGLRGRRGPGFGRAVGVAVLIVAVQSLLVATFAWPAVKTAPRDLPVVVAGPPGAATATTARLNAASPGAFKISIVLDEASAVSALRDRRAYAAIVVRPDGPALLVASAAAPAVAQALTQQVQALDDGQRVPVADVVPSAPEDRRGAGFAAGLLPLVLTSMVAGVLLATMIRSRWARCAGIVVYAALSGLAGAAVLRYWLAALTGTYTAEAAAVGLLALAVCGSVAGLGALLGRAGVALGVILTFVIGNPLSAAASAPEMLPRPWGELGQLLPPGAGATLLRSTAFFHGAGATAATWTLTIWAVGGLVLLLMGRRRAIDR